MKAITSVSKADLITMSGRRSTELSAPGSRVFSCLSVEDISTLMVTQSSADNVLCLAVHDADLKRAKAKLEKTFELEMLHDHSTSMEVMPHVAIVVAGG